MSIQSLPYSLMAYLFLATTIAHAGSTALTATDAWVAEAPPGASVLAAYLTLNNPSEHEAVIVGVTSPVAAKAEIHRTVLRDGLAAMEPRARVVVPAKDQVQFEPGGLHVMLIQPKQRFMAGAKIVITLHLEDGEKLPVSCTVRKRDGGHAHHHHHH